MRKTRQKDARFFKVKTCFYRFRGTSDRRFALWFPSDFRNAIDCDVHHNQ